MSYAAPIRDMLFVMQELAGLEGIAALPGCEDAGLDTAQAVLAEAARFSAEVLAPLNADGDRQPAALSAGEVRMTPGFKEAFRQFGAGGWQGLAHAPAFGGQGLPKLIAAACMEMIHAANMSFALCPMLSDAAIEALLVAGSAEQQQRYLPRLISGEWTGTMNLTEPQAGSDLARVRTRAEVQADGSYRLFGTKIFITYGEHDMAHNIVHLVLARIPGAPQGVKGISLFLVPKFLVNEDGSLGARNDVHCVSIEHKLGIKASPTAVLQFGDRGGAVGYRVGEPNRGLETMFIMMNAARFAVGMQGVAIASRASQQALAYARERVQGRAVDGSSKEAVAIIEHPDVRRMLATMQACTQGARALAYVAAAHGDLAHRHPEAATRLRHQAIYDYLVPIVKGWCTEMSVEVASLGVQVHGGMGFIEETGAAQHYRDARILPIYEGTTAIQANDLVGRKTLKDRGATVRMLLEEIDTTLTALASADAGQTSAAVRAMHAQLGEARRAYAEVIDFVLRTAESDPKAVYAGSVPYLKLAGIVLSGWQMARALLAAIARGDEDPGFSAAKVASAHFFADHLLPQARALAHAITHARGDEGVLALDAECF